MVGERWALLVVRELLLGPQRFSDLRTALPAASSNLLTDRLRELEARGVIARRKLAPPAGSWVYELTEWGRELEPILLALGDWGLRVPRAEGSTVNTTSMMLFLRGGNPIRPIRRRPTGSSSTIRCGRCARRAARPTSSGRTGESGGECQRGSGDVQRMAGES